MTLSASRVHENSPYVKVGITYGPVSTWIEEDCQYLRHFHGELGRLLDQMEAEAKAKPAEQSRLSEGTVEP